MYRLLIKEPVLCHYALRAVRRNFIEARVQIKYFVNEEVD